MKSFISRNVIAAVFVSIVIAIASGCAKPPPPPPPTIVQGTLTVDAAANPDARGRASPIVIRTLELKSSAGFDRSDFFSLWERPSETLGADLVHTEEYDLRPGDQRKFERMPAADARFFVVLAAYRDLQKATWRAGVPIAQNQTQAIVINVEALKVTLSRK